MQRSSCSPYADRLTESANCLQLPRIYLLPSQLEPVRRSARVLNRFGETTNGQPVPLGKPWDRQPNSGKLRRKLVSVPGLRRISGQLSPKRLGTPLRPTHRSAPTPTVYNWNYFQGADPHAVSP